jgi:N-acetylneuraminic acid mutarotase
MQVCFRSDPAVRYRPRPVLPLVGLRTAGRTGSSEVDAAAIRIRPAAARSSAAYTVLNGRILYAGGECRPKDGPRGGETFDDVAAYEPKTDRWMTLASLPSGRHAFAAATVGQVAYFVAGAPICGDAYSADLLALIFP